MLTRLKVLIVTILLQGSMFFNTVQAQNFEVRMLESINPQQPNSFIWKGASASVYPLSAAIPVGLFVYGLAAHDKSSRRKSYELAGSIVIAAIAAEGMKRIFNRERPAEKYPGQIFPYKAEYGKSFPSGHTTLAFATATSLSLQYKKWYVTVPAFIWAGGVAYSRMYLGVHYPSDVLGGAITGAGSALLSHWLCKKIFK